MLARAEALAGTSLRVLNHFSIPDSALSFSAACFSSNTVNMSLLPLQEREDTAKNPELTEVLAQALETLKAERAYAPSPRDFNGQIIQPFELTKLLLLRGLPFYRNKLVPADGTFLRFRGDAGVFSAGGCGVIVAVLRDRMLFAHMGRDCLIDRNRILNKKPRLRESVVDYIAEAMRFYYDDLSEMHVWVLYTIKPEDFLHRYDDPEHAVYNCRVSMDLMYRNLRKGFIVAPSIGAMLDLPTIAKLQFMRYGVPEENIHLEHQYLADELPHTRSGDRLARYLVAIARH
jgi:hypothetical protein